MSHLRCVECDRLWSAEAAKPGERCGVRLSGKHWCDGVLIEVKQLPAAVEQGLRDFSALRKEHDELLQALIRVTMWEPRSTEAACQQDYAFAASVLKKHGVKREKP